MGKSKIEWTDRVWNPVTGCTKVSDGCKNCYAERDFHRPYPGRHFNDIQLHPERLKEPLHLRKSQRIFVCSMGDLFHPEIPTEFIDRVLEVMAACPQHTFLVLTKRADLIYEKLYGVSAENGVRELGGGDYLPNLLLGVSVEDQQSADERIPILLQINAAVRFVSVEPTLGPVILQEPWNLVGKDRLFLKYSGCRCLQWVICGGESGPNARPMHPNWARSLRDQCQAAGVPFFFKQWGEWEPIGRIDHGEPNENLQRIFQAREDRVIAVNLDGSTAWEGRDGKVVYEKDKPWAMERTGKKAAGRLLDGREWNEFPKLKTDG